MTITIAPDRTGRAAELARRIVHRYGDDDLSNDLLELLVLVSDPDGSAERYDAGRLAMREVYAGSGMMEAALDEFCQRVEARTISSSPNEASEPVAGAYPATAGAAAALREEAH